MRSVSNRFKDLGLGKKDNTAADESDGSPGNSPQMMRPNHHRSASGAGVDGFGKTIKSKVAHTTILPNLIGSASLRELQDLITAEKGVLQSSDKLSTDIAKSCQSLATWGGSEGSDMSDILSHASSILMHLSQAFATYAMHEEAIRRSMKSIRTKEEELEELIKRRRSVGSRAEREEKKLAKMGQENKNLPSQTELLESLRSQMKEMDTDILTEEAKLGDFKRRTTKEALSLKFGGVLELAEKATIVGELGKLLIEEIPLEETPPGYGRSPYQGYEQTQRLSKEADRCVKEVVFNPPRIVSLPPGLPHHQPLDSLQTDSNAGHGSLDDYKRYAAEYGDDPTSPSAAKRDARRSTETGYPQSDTPINAHPAMATGLGTEYSYNPVTGQYDLQGVNHGSGQQDPAASESHVLFAGPLSPAVIRNTSYAPASSSPTRPTGSHDYEYEQARAVQDEWKDAPTHQEPERETAPLLAPATISEREQDHDLPGAQSHAPLASPLPLGGSLSEGMRSYMTDGPTSPSSPPGSAIKTKIMDRGRSNRQYGDGPGDQAHGGYNYGYDSSAFFVRNHASSPADLPKQEQVFPAPAADQTASPVVTGVSPAKARGGNSRDRSAGSASGVPSALPVPVPMNRFDHYEQMVSQGDHGDSASHPAPPYSHSGSRTRRSAFRPCIDLHDGVVKQIVGGTLSDDIDQQDDLKVNFVASQSPAYFASLYRSHNLTGGHVIKLGNNNDAAAREALAAWPGRLQIGGGINLDNAREWLAAGAEKVIITSTLFPRHRFSLETLEAISAEVGRDQLVVDISCRKRGDKWIVAMNKWRDLTDMEVNAETIALISGYCSELLIHAADVEGLCNGIDEELVRKLGEWVHIPCVYAGGAREISDLQLVDELSNGKVDLTFGSALDIFGGKTVKFEELAALNEQMQRDEE